MDWRLIYPGVDLTFGSRESGYEFNSPPEIGYPEITNADAELPGQDGVAFGVDTLAGSMIAFELDVLTGDRQSARPLVESLRHAWRADAIRRVAGATAELISDSGVSGFGRPRAFSPPQGSPEHGALRFGLEFALASDLWFGPEMWEKFTYAPAQGGGLVAPLRAPLSTTRTSDRSQVITVGGTEPTPHVQFEVAGPITNPVVEVLGVLRLEYLTTLAYDEVLEISAVPWQRYSRVGNASYAGALTPASTMLSQLVLPPGRHEVVLRGVDRTGTASLRTIWREAQATP